MVDNRIDLYLPNDIKPLVDSWPKGKKSSKIQEAIRKAYSKELKELEEKKR